MKGFFMIHGLVEENGKTIKENNLGKKHNIPVGSLVKIIPWEGAENYQGIQLHIIKHTRDCDGTPLYSLGINDDNERIFGCHGFTEDNLKTVL